MATTDICRSMGNVHPKLVGKINAILDAIKIYIPTGWSLEIYETSRTQERQEMLVKSGVSQTRHSKHTKSPAEAVDLVWKKNGKWTWTSPVIDRAKFKKDHQLLKHTIITGWILLDHLKAAYALRIISWDKPHCEL